MKAGVDDYPLFFVMNENNHDPIGIMTYADLNRRASYIYTYVLLVFLEQWIKKQILKKYCNERRKLSDEWMNTLSLKKRRDGITTKAHLIGLAKKKNESTLTLCGLDDLIHVLRNDPNLSNELAQIPRHTLPAAVAIRPKIAHPTKLIVPRKSAAESLRHLSLLWRDTISFIRNNDFNEKNGRWSDLP